MGGRRCVGVTVAVVAVAVGDWGLGGVRALIGDGRGGFGMVWWFEWFVSGGIGGWS
jgi:hypothetical protein